MYIMKSLVYELNTSVPIACTECTIIDYTLSWSQLVSVLTAELYIPNKLYIESCFQNIIQQLFKVKLDFDALTFEVGYTQYVSLYHTGVTHLSAYC